MCNRGKDGERGEGGSLPGGRVVYLEVEECEVEEFVSQGEGRKLSVLFMQACWSGYRCRERRGGSSYVGGRFCQFGMEWRHYFIFDNCKICDHDSVHLLQAIHYDLALFSHRAFHIDLTFLTRTTPDSSKNLAPPSKSTASGK